MQAESESHRRTRGYWRRIKLHPEPGLVSAGLEDDFHRFRLQLTHSGAVITRVDAHADRIPWSTCPDAGAFLRDRSVGQRLDLVASFDPHLHCTHLFELLVLCASHALDQHPTQFDIHIADRKDNRTCATLYRNESLVLLWEVNRTLIEEPGEWAGRDLRQLSRWKTTLTAELAEQAMLLRRGLQVSNGRTSKIPLVEHAADRGPARMGACFTYQMPRALNAFPTSDSIRDFSRSATEPLQDFTASEPAG